MKDRSDYQTRYFNKPIDCWYFIIDAGEASDPTVGLLMHYTLRGGGDFEIDDVARTKSQTKIARYDVQGIRRFSPDLAHSEQAAQIAKWRSDFVADRESVGEGIKVYCVLNISDIGEQAARSFSALKPQHFDDKRATPEHLHSLLVKTLNNETFKFADGLPLQMSTMDTERVGDARAVAIGIWSAMSKGDSWELRL